MVFAFLCWSRAESTISPSYTYTLLAQPPPSPSSLTLASVIAVPLLQQLSLKVYYPNRSQGKLLTFKPDLCAILPFLTVLVYVLNPYSA